MACDALSVRFISIRPSHGVSIRLEINSKGLAQSRITLFESPFNPMRDNSIFPTNEPRRISANGESIKSPHNHGAEHRSHSARHDWGWVKGIGGKEEIRPAK